MLTVCLASLADALANRSSNALLGFGYMAALTLYAVLLCGLATLAFPGIPSPLLRALQVGMGPLCCTLALVASGRWLHAQAEDSWICPIMHTAIGAMVLATIGLTVATAILPAEQQVTLLYISAATCIATTVLTGVCSWRAYRLGDSLAIGVLPTAGALGISIGGLYATAAYPGSLAPWAIAVTALSTVAYLLMIAALSITRTRAAKRLERLAGLHLGFDPITGLPTGSALVAKVDDSFWRSARDGRACNVVCMHLHNLYELADIAGQGVESQIALTMSARIRRAVGFRCVVGLYHARCFVAVIPVQNASSETQIQNYVQRLRHLISKPVVITGHQRTQHEFVPDWGIAVVSAAAQDTDSGSVLRQAERLAMQDGATAPAPLTIAPSVAQ